MNSTRRNLHRPVVNQCSAITLKGAQCRLNCRPGDNVCYTHYRQKRVRTINGTVIFRDVSTGKIISVTKANNNAKLKVASTTTGKIISATKSKDKLKVASTTTGKTPLLRVKDAPIVDEPPVQECAVCGEEFCDAVPRVVCTSRNHGHDVCRDCLAGYLNTTIGQTTSIECMMSAADKCGGGYLPVDVRAAVSDELYSKYMETIESGTLNKMACEIDDFHQCPFCAKYGIVAENIHLMSNTDVACESCHKTWCLQCRGEGHNPHSCFKIRQADQELVSRIVAMVIDRALLHECPKCHIHYTKTDGCNLMTCPRCHTYSCYLCNAVVVPINGRKYGHFNRTTKCTVYTGNGLTDAGIRAANEQYNQTRITSALNKLKDENKNDRQVLRMLTTEIAKHTTKRPPRPGFFRRWFGCCRTPEP